MGGKYYIIKYIYTYINKYTHVLYIIHTYTHIRQTLIYIYNMTCIYIYIYIYIYKKKLALMYVLLFRSMSVTQAYIAIYSNNLI